MSDDSLLGQLAEEFTRRVREGKPPDIEEYASRYPELAGRIRELFPTLMLLEGMAATSDSVTADALPSGLSPGSVFGQYRIEREIGRGGMGIVYEATHLLLEKRVALKMLPVRTPVDAAHSSNAFSARRGRQPDCTTPTSFRFSMSVRSGAHRTTPCSTSKGAAWTGS